MGFNKMGSGMFTAYLRQTMGVSAIFSANDQHDIYPAGKFIRGILIAFCGTANGVLDFPGLFIFLNIIFKPLEFSIILSGLKHNPRLSGINRDHLIERIYDMDARLRSRMPGMADNADHLRVM